MSESIITNVYTGLPIVKFVIDGKGNLVADHRVGLYEEIIYFSNRISNINEKI